MTIYCDIETDPTWLLCNDLLGRYNQNVFDINKIRHTQMID